MRAPSTAALPVRRFGPGLAYGRGRVVVVLLAHGPVVQQLLAAFGLQLQGGQIGLGLAQEAWAESRATLKGAGSIW